MNEILDRSHISNEIKKLLSDFDTHCKDVTFKKGFYIFGSPGCGKTEFVNQLLKELNYDIIRYDAGDVRNKSLVETIASDNISNRNVLHMMTKTTKKIAIVMDEIDGMNNGDKGGITALIKLIRQKKTRKQRMEQMTMNPIICIGNYYIDKKIRELMKVCNIFELKTPTTTQVQNLVLTQIPEFKRYSQVLRQQMLQYIQGDLRKWNFLYKIYQKNPDLINSKTLETILHTKSYNEDSKIITQTLISRPVKMEEHNVFMNETDRTIVALLWHENIVDAISTAEPAKSYPFYLQVLKNICYADYIDRITFQNQIWQFNEMSSLMKTFYNNKLYHDKFHTKFRANEIRFTKVLTKYSTEYNNMLFVYGLCQELDMDKKDMLAMFQELRMVYGSEFYEKPDKMSTVEEIFENYSISKLDIKRIYRYLDKNVKKEAVIQSMDDLDDDFE
jgi:DNA polymerase III delta prime subunit